MGRFAQLRRRSSLRGASLTLARFPGTLSPCLGEPALTCGSGTALSTDGGLPNCDRRGARRGNQRPTTVVSLPSMIRCLGHRQVNGRSLRGGPDSTCWMSEQNGPTSDQVVVWRSLALLPTRAHAYELPRSSLVQPPDYVQHYRALRRRSASGWPGCAGDGSSGFVCALPRVGRVSSSSA